MDQLKSIIFIEGLKKVNRDTYQFVLNHYGSVTDPSRFILKFNPARLPPIFLQLLKKKQVNLLRRLHRILLINEESNIEQLLEVFCFLYEIDPSYFIGTYDNSLNCVQLFSILNKILFKEKYLSNIEKKLLQEYFGYIGSAPVNSILLLTEKLKYTESALHSARIRVKDKINLLLKLSLLLKPYYNYDSLIKRESDLIVIDREAVNTLNAKHNMEFSLSFYLEFFSAFLPGEYQQIIFKLEHNPIYALIPLHLKEEFINSLST